MCISIRINNSNSHQILKQIDLADGKDDNKITADGVKKALENEPDLLKTLRPEEKNEIAKLLQSGSSDSSIALEFDTSVNTAPAIPSTPALPPIDKNNPPGVDDIIKRVNDLKAKHPVVPDYARSALEKLNGDERLMLGFALEEIKKMENNPQATESQYMINMLKHAAELSGGDRKKFVDLATQVFAAPAGGYGMESARGLAGGGAHISGEICEPLLVDIVKPRGGSGEGQGYNPNIIDSEDKSSTVTHHYGEFLKTGFSRGQGLGDIATIIMDKPWNNPGDVRNGYFAVMLGDSLVDKRIAPADSVKLTEWAYTKQKAGGPQPPWGEKQDGKNLGDYKIDNWVKAYNQAFPNDQIKIEKAEVKVIQNPRYPKL